MKTSAKYIGLAFGP